MKVILCEKPSMARDIAAVIGANQKKEGYLEGNQYQVTWAFGHLIEIAPRVDKWTMDTLPILDELTYTTKKEKGVSSQIKIIKNLFKSATSIVCACDAGREGELIFRLIYEHCGCKKPVERLWISSLTDQAIKAGFSSLQPSVQFDFLFHSAQARQKSDWYVGINATRALTLAANNGEVFSLGRVQTPTLTIICKRYLENKSFQAVPFWKLVLETEKDNITFSASSEKYEQQEAADKVLNSIENSVPLVKSVEKKSSTEKPPLLFDLTSLQKEGSKRYGFDPAKTLEITQALYEKKFVTYPRTGSKYIPQDVLSEIPALIDHAISYLDYQGEKKIYFQNNQLSFFCVDSTKITDHHALLPTFERPKNLSDNEKKIYDMIVVRMLEAFAQIAKKDITSVVISVNDVDFYCTGTVYTSMGYRVFRTADIQEFEEDVKEANVTLPILREKESLPNNGIVIKTDKTKAKPILTDASLLTFMETAGKDIEEEEAKAAMKDCGLGTPATRHAIIDTLIQKKYIQREKKQLIPTEKGLSIYALVKDKSIASPLLTGQWEHKLEQISKGQESYKDFMNRIFDYTTVLTKELIALDINIQNTKNKKMGNLNLECPKCGRQLHAFNTAKASGIGCAKDCDFVVWGTVAGKKLTENELMSIIAGDKPIIKGLRSSKNPDRKFDAHLYLDPQNGYKVAFEFPQKK